MAPRKPYKKPVRQTAIADLGEGRRAHQEYTPQQKYVLRALVGFLDAYNLKYHHSDVFKHVGVHPRSGWSMLRDNEQDTGNSSPKAETRGRSRKLSVSDITEADRVLQNCGVEGRKLSWEALAHEIGREDVGYRTMQRAIGTMEYRRCPACQKGWQSLESANRRLEWCRATLQQRPTEDDWKTVRSSDETHFGFSPEGKVQVIRKPGERYCADCIQDEVEEPAESDTRVYAWSAVGYNFKHPLVFYKVPSKGNSKTIKRQTYRDIILEGHVKQWLHAGSDFVLDENGDPGHGWGSSTKNNFVYAWKRQNGLRYYNICANSPDLTPVANCWQPVKQHLRSYDQRDEASLKEGVMEGWAEIKQDFIHDHMTSMPQRLKDVVEANGQFGGWCTL